MKSYTKIFALLLILTLAISGCVDKDTSKAESALNTSKTESATSAEESGDVSTPGAELSYAVYKAAAEKTEKLEAVDGSVKEQNEIDLDGTKMSMSTETSFKIDIEKLEAIIQVASNQSGMTMTSSTYLIDGLAYINSLGSKIKMEMPLEEMLNAQTSQEVIPESAVKSSGELTVDGIKYHKITVAGKDFLDLDMAISLKAQLEVFATEYDFENVEIDDIDILFLYEDGYIVKTKFEVEVSYADGEVEFTIGYAFESTLNNPGDAVEITAPTDLDQYIALEM